MRWLFLLLAIAAAALLLIDFDKLARDGNSAPVTPVADTSSPGADRRVFAAGVVEGTQREVPLQFEIAGRIATIHVTEGDQVAAGDVLAELDAAVWQQELLEAQANHRLALAERERLLNGHREETRAVARAEVEMAAVRVLQAEADRNRAVRLFQKQAISEQEYDALRFEFERALKSYQHARSRLREIEAAAREDEIKIADAKVQLAETAVQQARLMLNKTRLVAPSDGTILRIDAEPGQLVDPEHASPIIRMTNTETLRVRAWVEELDALLVEAGQSAVIVPEGRSEREYTGTITWVSPAMGYKQHLHHNPGEHLDVRVREILVAVKQPKGLVVGLPVELFIRAADGSSNHQPARPGSMEAGGPLARQGTGMPRFDSNRAVRNSAARPAPLSARPDPAVEQRR